MLRKGFATLIGLLIAAMITILMFLAVFKIYTKTSENNFTTVPETKNSNSAPDIINNAQDAADRYQQKGIQNQKIEVE